MCATLHSFHVQHVGTFVARHGQLWQALAAQFLLRLEKQQYLHA